jgi:hypothetical protein
MAKKEIQEYNKQHSKGTDKKEQKYNFISLSFEKEPILTSFCDGSVLLDLDGWLYSTRS